MRKLLIIILGLIPLVTFGQTDIQLTQQFLSRVNYNPAATGASEYLNAYLLARQQWVGYSKGAPTTQVLNAHNYFESLRSGMGLVIVNDKIGPTSSINAKLNYAYHIHFENRSYLSFGLGAGILHKKLDVATLKPEEGDDQLLAAQFAKYKGIVPDFDFGMEYNMEKFQIGASVTHLNVDPIKIGNLRSGRHFYLYSKYSFDLNQNWKLVPIVTGKVSGELSAPIGQVGVNALAYYKERVWFGGVFRMSEGAVIETVAGVVGLFVTDFLRLGYSYDYNPGPIGKYSQGSHEIMLSVRLGKGDSRQGVKTPRFFE